jgi:hypothetical protein
VSPGGGSRAGRNTAAVAPAAQHLIADVLGLVDIADDRSDTGSVKIARPSVAAAYNDTGAGDDSSTSPGNSDGGGTSYSAQALAAQALAAQALAAQALAAVGLRGGRSTSSATATHPRPGLLHGPVIRHRAAAAWRSRAGRRSTPRHGSKGAVRSSQPRRSRRAKTSDHCNRDAGASPTRVQGEVLTDLLRGRRRRTTHGNHRTNCGTDLYSTATHALDISHPMYSRRQPNEPRVQASHAGNQAHSSD